MAGDRVPSAVDLGADDDALLRAVSKIFEEYPGLAVVFDDEWIGEKEVAAWRFGIQRNSPEV